MVDLKLIKPNTIKLEATANIPDVSNDYNIIRNKPSINGVELVNNKTGKELKLVNETTYSSDLYKINNKINDTNKNINEVNNKLNEKIETINTELSNKQDKLIPGENITIDNNVISSKGAPLFIIDIVNNQTARSGIIEVLTYFHKNKEFPNVYFKYKQLGSGEWKYYISFPTIYYSPEGDFRISFLSSYIQYRPDTVNVNGYSSPLNGVSYKIYVSYEIVNSKIDLKSVEIYNFSTYGLEDYSFGNSQLSGQFKGLSIANTKSYTPSHDYNPSTKLYTDKTHYENMSGYDATKTQVLKNINGTLTWVSEE